MSITIQVAIENPVADDVTCVQMRKDVKGHLAGIGPILLLLHHNQSDHLRPVANRFRQIGWKRKHHLLRL
jgi:hypothetical protein